MRIGIMGTGMVGQTIGASLVELGHEVRIGTRDVAKTLARTEPDGYGNPPFSVWHKQNPKITLGTFAEAAAFGQLIINATAGGASLAALEAAGAANLNGKVLIDVANPLDASQGMPPSLSVSNTDSLGEQIQRAFPQVKVVKTLNTINAIVMVDPNQLADGDHHIFVSGDDADAKAQVTDFLESSFGWKHVIDLGDITTARGVEMYLPLWIRLFAALQTPMFNVRIVR
jgi:predicted dinucleotide-binding enzyme